MYRIFLAFCALFSALLAAAQPLAAQEPIILKLPHPAAAVAFAPDGKTLAAAGAEKGSLSPRLLTGLGEGEGRVSLWDLSKREVRAVLITPQPLFAVAFAPDGRTLAAVGAGPQFHTIIDGKLDNPVGMLWEAATGKELTPVGKELDETRRYTWAVFAPDNKTLAIASGVGFGTKTLLVDPATGKVRAVIASKGGGCPNQSVVFSPDGKGLAVGYGETVKLFNPETGKEQAALKGVAPGQNLAFAPDGKSLAESGCPTNGPIRLYEVPAGRPLGTLELKAVGNLTSNLAFSPDGRLLAAAAGGYLTADPACILLWDTQSRKLIAALKGHAGAVLQVAFSPDGRTLASLGTDQTVRLWNVSQATAGAKGGR